MHIIGEVLEILDGGFCLISSREILVRESQVVVCQESMLQSGRVIYLPKGEIEVALEQSDELYLCKAGRDEIKEEIPTTYSALFGHGTRTKYSMGPPKATFGDVTESTSFSKQIVVGDKVVR